MQQIVGTTTQTRVKGKPLPLSLVRAEHIKRDAVADFPLVQEHIRAVNHQIVVEAA
ncbi:hypothetical protein D3C76_1782050 [compost metagenome]